MVSQRAMMAAGEAGRHETSRERIFKAASDEFAARGFDGATVDRIAARARLNKAMLYYHFPGKAALYRAVLVEMFASVADAARAVRDTGGAPDEQLRGFVDAVAREGRARPHFPPIWLREIADAGRHIDDSVTIHFRSILTTLGEILRDGRAAGVYGQVNPFGTQLGIVGPLLLFLASAPIRKRIAPRATAKLETLDDDQMIDYVKRMTLAGVRAESSRSAVATDKTGTAARSKAMRAKMTTKTKTKMTTKTKTTRAPKGRTR